MSTVVAQPYSTAGNGGRKLVRLSNGTLIAILKEPTNYNMRIYKSTDEGANWSPFGKGAWSTLNGNGDYALVATGNTFVVISTYATSMIRFEKFDGITEKELFVPGTIDSNQSAVGNVSLAIDPTNGHLHAAWASKNATYPNSFNIRYAKSTDGGATWSAVTQMTNHNTATINRVSPCIVVVNSVPVILNTYQNNSFYEIHARLPSNNYVVYAGTTYVQSNPTAVVDKDGVIHVSWGGANASSPSISYIRYSKSTDGGVSWSTVETPNPSVSGTLSSITVDRNNQLLIFGGFSATTAYLSKRGQNASWTNQQVSDVGNNLSTLYDPTFTGQHGDIPPTIYQTSTSVQYIGTYTINNAPTIAITSPTNNQTLYENDTINISGDAYDADKDQSVTVFYQINNEARKVLATNLSQTQISLSKQLTFKGGKLYDGETALTGILADGVAHTLKVWAEDSEKASSAIIERTFYVVPNRAPLLTVINPTPSGIIDVDSFSISGTYSDADGNTTTVVYRINGGNSVQIAQGISGDFTFDVTLGSLQVGVNAITIEATDSYGAKTTKTVKLNKTKVVSPITRSTVRYKVAPPTGTASEILVWLQRDANLTLNASVSMTLSGEAESFVAMTKNATSTLSDGRVEDEFYHQVAEAKDSIVLKFDLTKSSVDANEAITLITGVF